MRNSPNKTQYNDTLHNDKQHCVIKHKDIQFNYTKNSNIQHGDVQNKRLNCYKLCNIFTDFNISPS